MTDTKPPRLNPEAQKAHDEAKKKYAATGAAQVASSSFVLSLGRKEAGFCESVGIEHAWQDGPSLTMHPPIRTRLCINCGKQQHWVPGHWADP